MLGNPYSSSEPGLGPLMRDVKNKICQDCELVALLEDDNGMELLVNNKIISLDLPVKEVSYSQFCNSYQMICNRQNIYSFSQKHKLLQFNYILSSWFLPF